MKEIINRNIQPDSPEKRIFELNRRGFFELMRSDVEQEWQASAEENKKKDFIKKIIQETTSIIPNATEEIEIKLNRLNKLDEKDNLETFLNEATKIIIELIGKYLTLEKLEQIIQTARKKSGNEILSRGLNFTIHHSHIELHIPTTFFENAQLALQSFVEGLKILAQKMTNDPTMERVTEVRGHSLLIKEKPRIARKLGFEITLDENGKPTDEARMSREKLLDIYGQK